MKVITAILVTLSFSAPAFAVPSLGETILSCKSVFPAQGASDSLKTIELVKTSKGSLKVLINGAPNDVVRYSKQDPQMSDKYVIAIAPNGDDKDSLYANLQTKQAVLVYESDLRGQVTGSDNRYNVSARFLKCK